MKEIKTDQPNGSWEMFQYHTYSQEPHTSTNAHPLSLLFSSPALQMISQPTSPKASITHCQWLPPNHPPGSFVVCLLDWYQTQHCLGHDNGSDCMSHTYRNLALTRMGIRAWLRCPGSFGEARIRGKYQHKCLKHLAGIYVTAPALGQL